MRAEDVTTANGFLYADGSVQADGSEYADGSLQADGSINAADRHSDQRPCAHFWQSLIAHLRMRYTSVLVRMMTRLCLLMVGVVIGTAQAAIEVYEFDSLEQEAQYRALIEELRCPKCQNQNLAGSDAPIAQDLKQRTYDLVQTGRSDDEIRNYMKERYGDFISYRPPVRPSTWILWFFPPLLLVGVIIGWVWRNVQRERSWRERVASGAAGDQAPSAEALSTDERQALDRLLAPHASDMSGPTIGLALAKLNASRSLDDTENHAANNEAANNEAANNDDAMDNNDTMIAKTSAVEVNKVETEAVKDSVVQTSGAQTTSVADELGESNSRATQVTTTSHNERKG